MDNCPTLSQRKLIFRDIISNVAGKTRYYAKYFMQYRSCFPLHFMLYRGNLEYFSDSVYVTYSYLSPCLKYTFLYVFVVASLGNSVPSPWQVLAIQYCVPSPWQQIFPCISRKSTNALPSLFCYGIKRQTWAELIVIMPKNGAGYTRRGARGLFWGQDFYLFGRGFKLCFFPTWSFFMNYVHCQTFLLTIQQNGKYKWRWF